VELDFGINKGTPNTNNRVFYDSKGQPGIKSTFVSGSESRGAQSNQVAEVESPRAKLAKFKCCMFIPINIAIRVIFVYELYHIFTEFQLLNFGQTFHRKSLIGK
jgi:hypothetical protein